MGPERPRLRDVPRVFFLQAAVERPTCQEASRRPEPLRGAEGLVLRSLFKSAWTTKSEYSTPVDRYWRPVY